MEQQYIEDKTFEKVDFRNSPLEKGEYECCTFKGCDFSGNDFTGIKFSDCVFIACNLSLVKLIDTVFNNVRYKDCKLLGLHFDSCSTFGLSLGFEGCMLDNSTFFKLKLKKTVFKDCQLQEVDFSSCDLSESVFDNCNLARATFNETNLEKADFRTAYRYSLNPETNRIKKAKFSLIGVVGLLDKYGIEVTV